MIDRENVIENLEQNIRWIEEIECHQFPGWGNVTMAMRDAMELLKEKEPISAIIDGSDIAHVGRCPSCRVILQPWGANYCFCCGKEVKWDDQ